LALVILASCLWPLALSAQDEPVTFPLDNFYAKIKKNPRSMFRNFKFGFSTGYGNTFFSHQLEGLSIYQQSAGVAPQVFVGNSAPAVRYTNWVNSVSSDPVITGPPSFMVSSDTAKIGFKGNALNIPFKLTLHYEFKGKYRIGAGYSYEMMNIGTLRPISYGDQIADFQPPASSGWMNKYFGILGMSFYRMGDYLFTGDVQIGGYKPGGNFDLAVIQKGVYVNLGVTVERELSEYLRVFVRPSYEIKSYTIIMPEGGLSINHHINAFYFNIGLSYSIPELRKCKIHDCKIQMNHAHGDREWRSRVHPIYKKQNPQYGENHPKLFKYKGKNKKRLNPY